MAAWSELFNKKQRKLFSQTSEDEIDGLEMYVEISDFLNIEHLFQKLKKYYEILLKCRKPPCN